MEEFYERQALELLSYILLIIPYIASAICSTILILMLVNRSKETDSYTPRLNLTRISINPNNPLSLVHLSGQRAGLIAKLSSYQQESFEMHVGERFVTIKSPSIATEFHTIIPVQKITAVKGYMKVEWSKAVIGLLLGGAMWPIGQFGIALICALIGMIVAFLYSSVCIAVSSGDGFFGYRYSYSSCDKKILFQAIEQIRLLLLRVQEGVSLPLPEVRPLPSSGARGTPLHFHDTASGPPPHGYPIPSTDVSIYATAQDSLPTSHIVPQPQTSPDAISDPSPEDTLLGVARQGAGATGVHSSALGS